MRRAEPGDSTAPARPPIRKGDRSHTACDPTDGRFTTPTTRRTIVRTGAKLAYAAPLVAASLKLSATNAAAAVSLGSLCEAGSVFFARIAFTDDTGGSFIPAPRAAPASRLPPVRRAPRSTSARATPTAPASGTEEEPVQCFARASACRSDRSGRNGHDSDGAPGPFSAATTRRTVVRTGAKLAYAAPLVAASFPLGAGRVGANGMVSPGCRPDICGAGGACGPCRDDLCLLLCSVELVPVCVDVTTPACPRRPRNLPQLRQQRRLRGGPGLPRPRLLRRTIGVLHSGRRPLEPVMHLVGLRDGKTPPQAVPD